MSYATIHQCANDQSLIGRATSACAAEGDPNPAVTVFRVIWPLAAASDVEAAYASALAGGNPDPGGDESVITDGMILANVQANLPSP